MLCDALLFYVTVRRAVAHTCVSELWPQREEHVFLHRARTFFSAAPPPKCYLMVCECVCEIVLYTKCAHI